MANRLLSTVFKLTTINSKRLTTINSKAEPSRRVRLTIIYMVLFRILTCISISQQQRLVTFLPRFLPSLSHFHQITQPLPLSPRPLQTHRIFSIKFLTFPHIWTSLGIMMTTAIIGTNVWFEREALTCRHYLLLGHFQPFSQVINLKALKKKKESVGIFLVNTLPNWLPPVTGISARFDQKIMTSVVKSIFDTFVHHRCLPPWQKGPLSQSGGTLQKLILV